MERPEQDAGPSTRAAIAAGSAVPGRRAGSLPGPASSLTASLPLDFGSKATAPAPARAPSFQPNLEPLRSTLTLEFSCDRPRANSRQHKLALVAGMQRLVMLVAALLRDDRMQEPEAPGKKPLA